MALKSIQGQAEWFVAFDKTNPTYNGTNHTGYYAEIFGTPSEVRIILPPVTSLTGFRNPADDVTGVNNDRTVGYVSSTIKLFWMFILHWGHFYHLCEEKGFDNNKLGLVKIAGIAIPALRGLFPICRS